MSSQSKVTLADSTTTKIILLLNSDPIHWIRCSIVSSCDDNGQFPLGCQCRDHRQTRHRTWQVRPQVSWPWNKLGQLVRPHSVNTPPVRQHRGIFIKIIHGWLSALQTNQEAAAAGESWPAGLNGQAAVAAEQSCSCISHLCVHLIHVHIHTAATKRILQHQPHLPLLTSWTYLCAESKCFQNHGVNYPWKEEKNSPSNTAHCFLPSMGCGQVFQGVRFNQCANVPL